MPNAESAKATAKEIVAKKRLKARDMLRKGLINAILPNLAAKKKSLKSNEEYLETSKRKEAGTLYDIDKLDTAHPEFEDKKVKLEDRAKYDKETVNATEKVIEKIKKDIETLEEDISKVETGETKVCLDKLNALADKMCFEG